MEVMKFKRILTVCAVLALAATSAFADIAYIGQNNGTVIPPLQGFTGPLGMDFDVNSSITINAMGVYNFNAIADTELVSQLKVAIFNRDTGTMVLGTDTTFQPDTAYTQLPGDAYDLFQSITLVTLAVGHYSVVAVGFNPNQPNGNHGFSGGVGATEGILDGSISYVGSSRYAGSNGTLFFPTTIDGGPPNRYDAGTFSVPEPGFYSIFAVFVVFALGLIGLFAKVRRRKNA
jgi:hypothetical protein